MYDPEKYYTEDQYSTEPHDTYDKKMKTNSSKGIGGIAFFIFVLVCLATAC